MGSVPDPTVEELKRTVSDLSKEVGRLRLLQEQREKRSKEADVVAAPAPPEQPTAPAMARPSSLQQARKCYFCGGLGHFIRDCAERKKHSLKEDADVVAGASSNGDTCAPARSYIRLHATFQRLIDMIMAGLAYEVCLVYLDGVIVFSSTFEEHFTRLRLVLSKLRDAGLKLKPSKCSLLQKQVSFLGHVVSGEGIKTDPEKVRVVADWPVPVNLREVRSFVGLCS